MVDTRVAKLGSLRESFIGTRAYISQQTVNSPRWLRGRMWFQLDDDSPFARFTWGNWWINTGAVGEVAGTGNLQMSAAVENIAGGITPKASQTIGPGGNIELLIPGNFKKYTWYGLRYWAYFDAQMIFRGKWNTTGDNFEFSATELSDNTEGGAYGGAGGSPDFCFPPVAITGMTRKPAIGIIGDSRGAGQEDLTRSDRRNLFGPFERGLAELGIPWANFSRPALRAEGFAASGARSTALINKYGTGVINALGINDMAKTSAEVIALLETINSRFTVERIVQATLEANTSSNDAYVSVAGQTPVSSNTKRNEVNAWARANTKISGIVDVAAYAGHPTNQDVFAMVPYGAPTGIVPCDSLGLHMLSPSIISMVQRGLIQPQMFERIAA